MTPSRALDTIGQDTLGSVISRHFHHLIVQGLFFFLSFFLVRTTITSFNFDLNSFAPVSLEDDRSPFHFLYVSFIILPSFTQSTTSILRLEFYNNWSIVDGLNRPRIMYNNNELGAMCFIPSVTRGNDNDRPACSSVYPPAWKPWRTHTLIFNNFQVVGVIRIPCTACPALFLSWHSR